MLSTSQPVAGNTRQRTPTRERTTEYPDKPHRPQNSLRTLGQRDEGPSKRPTEQARARSVERKSAK
jgi:hypothetical protein